MTNKQLTRERIELIANFHRTMTLPPSHDEIEELARMALSAMDSEPVAWTSETALSDVACEETSMIGQEGVVGSIPLYRHAQQPVVPPMQHWEELCCQYPDMSIRDAIIRAAWWNHCRAAMLQAVPLTNEWDIALHNYRTALEGIGHIRRTLEETFGGLHGTHVEPDVLAECKAICDAIYAAYGRAPVAVTDDELNAAPHDTPALNSVQSVDSVAGKWIPVSERMPDVGVKVLCFPVKDEPIHATFNGQLWLQDVSWSGSDDPIDNVIPVSVTHWMPLPAAPQEEKP